MKKHYKHRGGRPTVMTPLVISKLEEGFASGCTDIEACLYAGISTQSLYMYQKKNPGFIKRKEELRCNPKLLARLTIAKDLEDGNINTAKWYVERTIEEFNPKKRLQIQHDFKLIPDDRLLDEYKKLTGITEGSGEVIDAEIVDQIEHNPDDS